MLISPKFIFVALFACLLPSWATAAELSVHVETAAGAPVEDAIVFAVPNTPLRATTGAQYVIDQEDRQFLPRVNVIQTGTSVSFPNSDNIRHSVYSFSPAKVFNIKLYAGKPSEPVVFEKPGLVVLGCNIHDIMVAWVMVVDTPYFAHSDRNGVALLRLPPGEYHLHTWHTPMTEDQQLTEPLRVEAAPASVSKTVRISIPLDLPGSTAKSK